MIDNLSVAVHVFFTGYIDINFNRWDIAVEEFNLAY